MNGSPCKYSLETAAKIHKLFAKGFIIIDLEGTASSSDPDVSIIEICIIDSKGDIILNSLVKPGCRISAAATRVHGLGDRDVAGAPALKKLWPEIEATLTDREVISYNAPADKTMLLSAAKQHSLPPIQLSEWHDAMKLYMSFRFLKRQIKLSAACHREQIAATPSHRALSDCLATLELIKFMASHQ